MGRTLIGVGLGLALLACGLTTIRRADMAPHLQYTGFSFARPPSESWFIRKSEESRWQVIVRRDPLPGEHHDAFVSFRIYRLEFDLAKDELADWTRKEDQRAETVIRVRSYALEPASPQNQACVDTKLDADVTSRVTDAPLRMLNHAITCIHPAFQRSLFEAMFSERGPPDAVGQDPALAAEAEAMLRGFEIDVAAGVPAK